MDALRAEVRHPRTWETQYQMVMALAECRFGPALDWLIAFAGPLDGPSMLAVGVADAVVRLSTITDRTDEAVEWALRSGRSSIAEGALRALAMTRVVTSTGVIDHVLAYLRPLPSDDGRRFWAAVASVDWLGDATRLALEEWALLPRADVADAARLSLAGCYGAPSSL